MSIVSLRSVFIGILDTVTMDLLSVTASKFGLIAFLRPGLTGHWFALLRGEYLHSDIAQMPFITKSRWPCPLLMFPAMGYGWFGTHGPPGRKLFPSSLFTHGSYGIGFWLGASLLT